MRACQNKQRVGIHGADYRAAQGAADGNQGHCVQGRQHARRDADGGKVEDPASGHSRVSEEGQGVGGPIPQHQIRPRAPRTERGRRWSSQSRTGLWSRRGAPRW